MSQLFDLDPPSHRVEAAVGDGDQVEGIDDLGALGKTTV